MVLGIALALGRTCTDGVSGGSHKRRRGPRTMKTKTTALRNTALESIAMASIGMTLSSTLFAGGTTPLTVNAKISGVCKVTAAPATLDFGTIDPSGGSN